MKEYKFRVWEKSTKSFHWPKQGVFDLIFRNLPLNPESDCIIQQYIGKKDAKEKEIYEGDIITTPIKAFGVTSDVNLVVQYDEFRAKFDAYWPEPKNGEPTIPMTIDGALHNCKVIGNVFENPELLK